MPAGRMYKYKSRSLPRKSMTVSRVKRIVNASREKKHHDEAIASTEINTTGAIVDLLTVAQGDSDLTRDGDQLYLTNFSLKYYVNREANATGFDIVRVLLFQWKPRDDEDVPTLAKVISTSVPPMGHYGMDNKGRFKILYDKIHALGDADGALSSITRNVSISKALLKKVQFNAASTDGYNKVYIGFLGATATGVNASSIVASSRAIFTDA